MKVDQIEDAAERALGGDDAFTAEELRVLRDVIEGYKSIRWLGRMIIAVAAVVGAGIVISKGFR